MDKNLEDKGYKTIFKQFKPSKKYKGYVPGRLPRGNQPQYKEQKKKEKKKQKKICKDIKTELQGQDASLSDNTVCQFLNIYGKSAKRIPLFKKKRTE